MALKKKRGWKIYNNWGEHGNIYVMSEIEWKYY